MDGEVGWWTTSGNIGLPHYQGSWEWVDNNNNNLDIITQISREYGIEINSEKSCVMIFNVKEQHEHLCNIKVVQKMKYLGIETDNKRNYFKTQRGKNIENARKWQI